MTAPDGVAAVERWFLREGMPWVLPERRGHPAVARMLPVTAALGASAPVFALLGSGLLSGIDPARVTPEQGLLLLAVLLAGIVVATGAPVRGEPGPFGRVRCRRRSAG